MHLILCKMKYTGSRAFAQVPSRLCILILFICLAQLSFADAKLCQRKNVKAFITQMVKKHHFKRQYLITLFHHVKMFKPIKAKKPSKPLEQQTWGIYQMLFVSEWRIQHGVKYWNKHAAILKKAEKQYGVPAAIIVATLGVETKYGQRIGGSRVLDVLGNLAFNHNRRNHFFRSELESFLLLTRKYHLDPLKVVGSYAGAIGKPQFMPSSYLHYGINFSKRAKVDLIHNDADVIASIANYYHKHGWRPKHPVAVRAYLLGQRYNFLFRKSATKAMTLSQLSHYGVMPKYEASDANTLAKVIALDSNYKREYWISFHNFDVIKRYNSSNLYAMAVYQLSNYIAELREKLHDD